MAAGLEEPPAGEVQPEFIKKGVRTHFSISKNRAVTHFSSEK
jgi:hypothetical protein